MLIILYSIVVSYITVRKSKVIPENWELAWCSQLPLHVAKNKLFSLSWATVLPCWAQSLYRTRLLRDCNESKQKQDHSIIMSISKKETFFKLQKWPNASTPFPKSWPMWMTYYSFNSTSFFPPSRLELLR